MSSVSGPLQVLLVEDDPGDVLIAQEAFALAGNGDQVQLTVVGDGLEALALLDELQKQGPNALPDLVLLDLNLPRMGGLETLDRIKHDPRRAHVPVVVLTTSRLEEDVTAAWRLHANAYVTKPVDFDDFVSTVHQVHQFFRTVVRLPGPTST